MESLVCLKLLLGQVLCPTKPQMYRLFEDIHITSGDTEVEIMRKGHHFENHYILEFNWSLMVVVFLHPK